MLARFRQSQVPVDPPILKPDTAPVLPELSLGAPLRSGGGHSNEASALYAEAYRELENDSSASPQSSRTQQSNAHLIVPDAQAAPHSSPSTPLLSPALSVTSTTSNDSRTSASSPGGSTRRASKRFSYFKKRQTVDFSGLSLIEDGIPDDAPSITVFDRMKRGDSASATPLPATSLLRAGSTTRQSRALVLVAADTGILQGRQRATSNASQQQAADPTSPVSAIRPRRDSLSALINLARVDRLASSQGKKAASPSSPAELIPAHFDPWTHDIEDLLRIASALHTQSLPAQHQNLSHRNFKRDQFDVPLDDAKLALSTRLYQVLSERGNAEGKMMYG